MLRKKGKFMAKSDRDDRSRPNNLILISTLCFLLITSMVLGTVFYYLYPFGKFPKEDNTNKVPVPWPNDPNFLVGVCGQPSYGNDATFWSGYGPNDTDIERQIHLLAEMGAKIYRLSAHDINMSFLEKVITLCEKYGIEVMLTVTLGTGSNIPERFSGRVKYYHIDNEIDLGTLRNPNILIRTSLEAYYMSTDIDRPIDDLRCLDIRVNRAIQLIKIIREKDPNGKVLIDGGGATDYVFLNYVFERLREEGVDIDYIGWHWYSDSEGRRDGWPSFLADGLNSLTKHLYETYGKEIIICEYNYEPIHINMNSIGNNAKYVPHLSGNNNSAIDPFEEDNMDILVGPYLVNNLQYLYQNRKENHIKGFLVFELMSQPAASSFTRQFGIVYSKMLTTTGRNYQTLGPKVAYYHLQKLLGGGSVPIIRLNPAETLPDYTITAAVIDVDTNDAVLLSQNGGTVSTSGVTMLTAKNNHGYEFLVLGSAKFQENSVATLTATANSGYEFLGWYRGGIRISRNPAYKFTVYEDANILDRDSITGKFAYEARYVYRGACEDKVITFSVASRNGVQNTGMLTIPEKTFGADIKIDIKRYSSSVPAAKSSVEELHLTNMAVILFAPGNKPEKEMELILPYNDSDIAGLNEDNLVMARYDQEKNIWVPLASIVDKDNKQIKANIDKLTLYAIMGTATI